MVTRFDMEFSMSNSQFGKQVRYDRKSSGMTVRELASQVSIDYSYVSKIENGKATSRLSVDVVRALAKALGADELDYFRLSGLLPTQLSNTLHEPRACQFMKVVSSSSLSEGDWDALIACLNKRLGSSLPTSCRKRSSAA